MAVNCFNACIYRNKGRSKMEIIKIRNLSFTFEGREKAVLNNIDFNIKKGEFAVFCGLLKRK